MSYRTGTIDCSGLQILHCIVIYKKIHIKIIVARCFVYSNIITELEWKREAPESFWLCSRVVGAARLLGSVLYKIAAS